MMLDAFLPVFPQRSEPEEFVVIGDDFRMPAGGTGTPRAFPVIKKLFP